MKVVYCCTETWIYYMKISLYSLLCNNKNNISKIYLFTEVDIIDDIDKISKEFNVEIIIFNYKNYINKYISIPNFNKKIYSDAALTRLYLSKIINEEKIIYFDVDTIILDDISELDDLELKDYYLAGVLDKNIEMFLDYMDMKGLPEKCINTGVLILNLKKIRAEKIDNKWLKLVNDEFFRFPDQDVINKVCQKKILLIDNKYNSSISCGFVNNMKILHYSTPKEDWVKKMPFSEKWYEWEQKFNIFIKTNYEKI